MKVWTILLILASLTFASVSWVADTQSTITTQPLIVNNRIVVGTEDGTLYAFSPASGSRSWDVALEGYVEDAILFGGDIIALTRNGKVVRVRSL
ncbi:MAG TPA: PQQ-binding-like beta-propeller repeat protein, partial [Candidatus Bilamarchaeaceae archaeon]|nr:PQQ-binding-like beta-propeller repeat protein [Candidatus Bilamarchaeaceae archaeon]